MSNGLAGNINNGGILRSDAKGLIPCFSKHNATATCSRPSKIVPKAMPKRPRVRASPWKGLGGTADEARQ